MGILASCVSALAGTPIIIAVQDFDLNNDALPGSFNPAADNLDGGGGDFWGVGNRNAWPQGFPSPGVPFGIADDSVFGYSTGASFPTDDEGIFGANSDLNNDYFAMSDSDVFGAGQTATWQFDVSGYSHLSISIEIGSDLDADFPYDAGSFVTFVGQIDAGSSQTLFTFTPAANPLAPGALRPLDGGSNENAQNLLFASGDATITKTFTEGPTSTVSTDLYLDKSRVANGALDVFSSDMTGTGATLTITVTADMPFEAVVFDSIRVFGEPDCNTNGVSDSDDISAGTSADCNANSVPDECELFGNDCNANSVPDECDSNPEFSNQKIITLLADGARSVVASDLDGDGDLDVLSVSNNNNTVEWYENIDGFGLFGAANAVSAPTESASSAIAADLDDDGDQDVLLASFSDSTIAWYQNTDGHGSFGPRQVISSVAFGPLHVIAVDLDGDTDKDVVYAGNTGFNIATQIEWFENLDGMGTFGPRNLIFSENSYESRSLHAADLDGDGDSDILAPGAQADRVDWFENTDGNGNFGPPRTITTLTDFAASAVAADLDGDGDLDVLSGSALDDKVAWYENTNGSGSFGPQRVISTTGSNPSSLVAVDLDHDGDFDVAVADFGNDSIGWYENIDGQGTFGTLNLISNDSDLSLGADIAAADLDGNNRIYVLSASIIDDTIAWYPNTQMSIDCNGNGVLDECDIAQGTSTDCNSNGLADDCDISSSLSADCNLDGILDECNQLGDIDVDGDVDLSDYAAFESCLGGPEVSSGAACCLSDLDGDGDTDLADFLLFQSALPGG